MEARRAVRRWGLLPLTPLYWLGTTAKNFTYDRGLRLVRQLTRPVISVGSLSAGGAGKTPVVMMLADLLARRGISTDVLSRGYGRGSGVAERVDASGNARRFGDEPVEMARAGLAVFVGSERYEAGVLAEQDGAAAVHLLDDGFQHRRLGRTLDVVLLTLQDVGDVLLPAGNLREPIRSLGRAHVMVVRADEAAGLERVTTSYPKAAVWMVRRRIEVPAERPRRPMAFCGIARPDGFFAMLRDAGCELAGTIEFADHHEYGEEDFGCLVEAARHARADGFVMTAKDAVKIPDAAMRRLEEAGMVWVARLRVELIDEDAAITTLREATALA